MHQRVAVSDVLANAEHIAVNDILAGEAGRALQGLPTTREP